MRYILIFFIIFSNFLFADKVEIESDRFEADENKLVSKFIGNVKIRKNSDEINSSKLFITFDKEKKPIRYEAVGNASFRVVIGNKHYEGNANIIIYEPKSSRYTFKGNAFLHEIDTGKKVYGEKIFVDEATGRSEVVGEKGKPVKFIFETKDK
jgi:lipopolysaccharide export system protein LptA